MRRIIKFAKGSIWVVKDTQPNATNTHITTKTRPYIIVSNDTGNYYSPNVLAIPCTSQLDKTKLPTHYEVLLTDTKSIALAEEIKTIPKTNCTTYLGSLNKEEIKELNKRLATALDIDIITKEPETIKEEAPAQKPEKEPEQTKNNTMFKKLYSDDFKRTVLKFSKNHTLAETAAKLGKTKDQTSKLLYYFKTTLKDTNETK